MSFRIQSKLWLGAAFLVFALEAFSQSIRVAAWNLQSAPGIGASPSNDVRIAEAAAALKTAEPDVILLQNVPDWKSCDRLVEALKPGKYYVLVCSSFRDGTNNASSQRQVAILSKYRGYSSWSEPWRGADRKAGGGGFAFAALRIANQPLGFYSVDARGLPNGSPDLAAAQLAAHAQSVQKWEANRVDATTAAFTFEGEGAVLKNIREVMLRSMEDAGFGFAVRDANSELPAGDYVLTEPPGLVAQPKILSSASFQRAAGTYDVELEPAKLLASRAVALALLKSRPPRPPVKVVAATTPTNQPARAQPAATTPTTRASSAAATSPARSFDPKWTALIAAGGLTLLVGLGWLLLKGTRHVPAREPKLLAESGTASSYTIIVGAPSTTGVSAVEPVRPAAPQPVVRIESPRSTHTQTEMLRRRAETAEQKAERAQEAIRSGVVSNLSHWLKQKFVRRLIEDRSQMLETQHSATMKALAVEKRLTRIETQIKVQNLGYQQRIDELTRELIAAKEENRELIRAQIRQVKAEMEEARARMLAQAKDGDAA